MQAVVRALGALGFGLLWTSMAFGGTALPETQTDYTAQSVRFVILGLTASGSEVAASIVIENTSNQKIQLGAAYLAQGGARQLSLSVANDRGQGCAVERLVGMRVGQQTDGDESMLTPIGPRSRLTLTARFNCYGQSFAVSDTFAINGSFLLVAGDKPEELPYSFWGIKPGKR